MLLPCKVAIAIHKRADRAATRLIYHAFGLEDHDSIKPQYINWAAFNVLQCPPHVDRSPQSDSPEVIHQGYESRPFKTLPIGYEPTSIALPIHLKEDLWPIWTQRDKATVYRVLHDWIRRAELSCIDGLHRFAEMLVMYRTGMLAYYACRLSTLPLEGANNKSRTMKRQAYGGRDREFFRRMI